MSTKDLSQYITEEGMAALISSQYIKGAGKAFATKFLEVFGKEMLDPDFDWTGHLHRIPGLGETKIKSVADSIKALPLPFDQLAFVFSGGISASDAVKIVSHYKKKTVDVILEDPYQMVENVWKLPFFTVDKFGKMLGIKHDDPRRLRGVLLTAVRFYAERGSMYATEEQVLKSAVQLSGADEELLRAQLKHLVADERLVRSSDGFYLPVYYQAEKEAAEKLGEMMRRPPLDDTSFPLPATDIFGHPYNRAQRDAIKAVRENPVTIITGGPGTGKTTIIRGLIQMFNDMEKKVILVAPTGRAAKRMSDLSGYEASTIHRLLGYRMGRGYRNKTFDADVLIIDEASMLEQVLFNHLLQAMKKGTRIVLVGDTDQLPPIGAGDVLRQLLDSGTVPVVNLTENFRQHEGSGIAASAAGIKQGDAPAREAGKDFLTAEASGIKATKQRITELLTQEIPKLYGVAPRDIQIVTPQQEGPLGAKQLNAELQEIVNPDAPGIKKGTKTLRLGDRVIQKSNDSSRNVYNGETGYISALDPQEETFEVTFHDGKKLSYDKRRMGELSLAYATTVHKLQGSETDFMILLMSMAHRRMLYRNLLYTAVSRARKLCVVLGERKALEMAVENVGESTRNSAFKKMLNRELEKR